MTPLLVAVFLLVQLSPVTTWDSYAKLIVAMGVGLLTISGALFWFAWGVAKKARNEWQTLAGDWAKTTDFAKAVNDARQPLTEKLILEIHIEMDRRIGKHDDSPNAHRQTIRHEMKGSESALAALIAAHVRDLQRQIDENRQRLDKLDGWDGGDRRGRKG